MIKDKPSMVPSEILVINDANDFKLLFVNNIELIQKDDIFIPIQAKDALSASSFVVNESINIDDA